MTQHGQTDAAATMRALVFLGDGQLAFVERPRPAPAPGQARVRIARAAVCGTDVHKLRRPPARQPRHPDGQPVVSGHEPVGWVDALGPGAPGEWLGQRVLVAGVVGCGACAECASGYNTACARAGGLHGSHDGSNAPYLLAPARNLIPLPDALSFDAAVVLTCAGGTAITVLQECAPALAQGARGADEPATLAIVGLGPVGLVLALLARARGHRVVGLDVNPARLAHAQRLDLQALDARAPDVVDQVRARHGGRGADCVAECAGSARARQLATQLARRRGWIALAGIGEEPDPESLAALAIKHDLVLRGIAATPLRYFPTLVAEAAPLGLERLISHRYPLSEAPAALARMATGDGCKIVLDVAQTP